jgi:hypothetical protein
MSAALKAQRIGIMRRYGFITGEFFFTISDFIVIGLVLRCGEGWSVISSRNKIEGSFDQPKSRHAADGVSRNVLAPREAANT